MSEHDYNEALKQRKSCRRPANPTESLVEEPTTVQDIEEALREVDREIEQRLANQLCSVSV